MPSQTELLYDLGLHREVVGITKFCVHPEHWASEKRIIGGTKNFWFDAIDALKPDLVLGNKEENYQEGIEKLQEKYPVWISDIVSMADAHKMIEQIGALTDRSQQASEISQNINLAFGSLQRKKPQTVLYLIWRQPWMAAGTQTFIHTMLEQIGLVNCLSQTSRYPELTDDALRNLSPELIFLSSEPFPFQEHHRLELQKLMPTSKIILVDGEMFSWYGSRLIKAPEYLSNLEF